MMRNSFTFYRSFAEGLAGMDDATYRRLMDAIVWYALDGEEPQLSGLEHALFLSWKANVDASNQRRENGSKGGRPHKSEPEKPDSAQDPQVSCPDTPLSDSESMVSDIKTIGFENENQWFQDEKPNKNKKEKEKEKEKIKENTNLNEKEKEKENFEGEEEGEGGAEPKIEVIALPLNTGAEHSVTEDDVDEYRELYPAVDVIQELRKMRGWLLANPTRRKTARGIRGFIVSWLSKEQDHSGSRASPAPAGQIARMTDDEFADAWRNA